MRKQKLILLVMIFCSATFLWAQKESYDKNADIITYDYFIKNNYEKLISTADSLFERGIDFYFLRMRLGIMYYNEKNYISAIPHFEKAKFFRYSDTLATEYLYYSYLFSGRQNDANILVENLSSPAKKKIGFTKPKFFAGVYSEFGYTHNSGYNNIKNSRGMNNDLISVRAFNYQTYLNISLIHNLSDRISIFHGYNNIYSRGSSITENNGGKQIYKTDAYQNEYYLNTSYYAGNGFLLSIYDHFVNIKYDYINFNNSNNEILKNSSNENLIGVSIFKTIGHTNLGYALTYSNFNDSRQIQNNFSFLWYPLGNLDLYNVSNIIFHSDKEVSSQFITRGIFDQKIGIRIIKNLWLEGVITIGDMLNYSEDNGFIVYNVIDKIKLKTGFNFIYSLNKYIQLSLRYLYLNQENTKYYNITGNNFYSKTDNQNIHKIIGGFKWTF